MKKLPIDEFLLAYGGCGKDEDENLRLCCPPDNVEVALTCDPPAENLGALGCVRPVTEELTWHEARDNCRIFGGNIITGLKIEMHLRQLRAHFLRVFHRSDKPHVWLGVYRGEYVSGKGEKPPEYYWYPGYPRGGNFECAYVDLQEGHIPLIGVDCTRQKLLSFCYLPVY
ncbi:uncharacterized protein [Macrobrachium rosenbergii]|uniref:uncharacterized protein n=1 Tax=Macrobrachium rosenbergii TaxID=79674 RepID=UPI0034D4E7F1